MVEPWTQLLWSTALSGLLYPAPPLPPRGGGGGEKVHGTQSPKVTSQIIDDRENVYTVQYHISKKLEALVD